MHQNKLFSTLVASNLVNRVYFGIGKNVDVVMFTQVYIKIVDLSGTACQWIQR